MYNPLTAVTQSLRKMKPQNKQGATLSNLKDDNTKTISRPLGEWYSEEKSSGVLELTQQQSDM